jgi:uncharacterized protein (DUF2225 family)
MNFLTRSLRCPVCGTHFSVDLPRPGSVIGRDTDFRPQYDGPDALALAIDNCPDCRFAGYATAFGWELAEDEEEPDWGLSWNERAPLPQGPPADEVLEPLRRWVRRKEHLRDLGIDAREPDALERYVLAARCHEFVREHDNPGVFDLWLRAAWCARTLARVDVERACLREAIPRLMATLEERQFAAKDRARATYLLAELSRRSGDFTRALDFYGRASEMADPDDSEGRLLRSLADRQVTLASAKSSVNAVIRDEPADDEEKG